MAKKKTEKVVEKAAEDNVVKVDLKQTNEDDNIIKVNLDKPPTPKEDEVKEEVTKDNADNSGVVELVEDANTTEKQEEVQPEAETQETPVLEEITEEEVQEQTEGLKEEVLEAAEEAEKTGMPLPENLQKVVDFMEETGGTLEDYVRLNQDYSSYDLSLIHI